MGSVRQRLHVYWGFTKNSDTDRYFAVFWPGLLWDNWLYTEDITITFSIRKSWLASIANYTTTIKAGKTSAEAPYTFTYSWSTNEPANLVYIHASGAKLGTKLVLINLIDDTSVSFAWHDYNI